MIVIKKIHYPPDPNDGLRVLVDQVWPRGLRKERVRIDEWRKDLAGWGVEETLRRYQGSRVEMLAREGRGRFSYVQRIKEVPLAITGCLAAWQANPSTSKRSRNRGQVTGRPQARQPGNQSTSAR